MRRIDTLEEGHSRGRIKEIYHDIEHTLGVPFVGAIFRALAAHPGVLEPAWSQLKPNIETQAFVDLSAQIRRRFDALAEATYELTDLYSWMTYHGFSREDIRRVLYVLEMFHYVDPKLLLCTAALTVAIANIENPRVNRRKPSAPRAQEPEFPTKLPHVMIEQATSDVKEDYLDIVDVMGLPIVPDEFEALANWPNLLRRMWTEIKPSMRSNTVLEEAGETSELAIESAQELPYSIRLEVDDQEVRRIVETFLSLHSRVGLAIAAIRWMVMEGQRLARVEGRAAGERSPD